MLEQNNCQICVVLQTKYQLRHQINAVICHFVQLIQSLRVHVKLATSWQSFLRGFKVKLYQID
jgi:hypothetical protein